MNFHLFEVKHHEKLLYSQYFGCSNFENSKNLSPKLSGVYNSKFKLYVKSTQYKKLAPNALRFKY